MSGRTAREVIVSLPWLAAFTREARQGFADMLFTALEAEGWVLIRQVYPEET